MADVNVNFPPSASPVRFVSAGDVDAMITQIKADVEGQVSELSGKVDGNATNLNSRGVSLIDFESKKVAVANGYDWTPVFNAALTFLAESTEIKSLSIPARVFPCLGMVNITSAHNGITITGEGYNTEIKIADGATQNWLFNLYDSTKSVEGVTIRNLRLNGNKANLGNTGTTGFGIFAHQGTGIENKNIFIENIWAHDFLTTGVNAHSSNTMVSKIFSWNNSFHGVTTAGATNIILSDLECHNNNGYGIDISGGEVILSNFNCKYNKDGGMKTSVSTPTINLRAINGRLNNNIGVGFQTTQSNGATYFFDNIEANDNGLAGFLVSEGVVCMVGKLTALRNNSSVPNNLSGNVSFKIRAHIDTLITSDGNGYGLSVESNQEVHIKRLITENNTNSGVWLNNATGAALAIESGSVLNNGSLYGINVQNNPNKLSVRNTAFGDTRATKVQTRGIFMGTGSNITVIDCDLTESTSSPRIFDNGAAAVVMRGNKGHLTENFGTKVSSANGVTTAFPIPHGLAYTPNYVSVTGLNSQSNSGYVVSVNSTNIVITFTTPPPSGTDNLSWMWEAKYKK